MIRWLLILLWCAAAGEAAAHKPSDAYVRLTLAPDHIAVSADIALRDLDGAIGLDANGDGALTWGEVRARQPAIAAYLTSRLRLERAGTACRAGSAEHLIDRHTDGTYAVLRYEAVCPGHGPVSLTYGLLFDIDPTHRGLVTVTAGGGTQSFVLSPAEPRLALDAGAAPGSGFLAFYRLGIQHIAFGWDHLLFLIVMLLPAVFRRVGRRWQPTPELPQVVIEVAAILTAFTLAHAVSLTLAVLRIVDLPTRLVESAIAATIILAALDNLWPLLPARRWQVAFGFGLIHGLGFASALIPMQLPTAGLATALLAFNLGIETGQLVVAALFIAAAYPLRRLTLYPRGVLPLGSLAALALAGLWLADRALALRIAPF